MSSLVHLWMRQEVRRMGLDLGFCQPDQSSRCPSREEAQETNHSFASNQL